MNNVILCEGSTDYVLLQYYMQRVHRWVNHSPGKIKYDKKKSRQLNRNGKEKRRDFPTL